MYAWALLVLLYGHREGISWVAVNPLVDEWVNAVLRQKERYSEVHPAAAAATAPLACCLHSLVCCPSLLSHASVSCAARRALAASDR